MEEFKCGIAGCDKSYSRKQSLYGHRYRVHTKGQNPKPKPKPKPKRKKPKASTSGTVPHLDIKYCPYCANRLPNAVVGD